MFSSQSAAFRLEIDGRQNVRNIHATHERLGAALMEHQAIEIDCTGVTEFDLSLIQLILAAKRSAQDCGKSLTLAAPAAGALHAALDRAGFLASERADTGDAAAFWLKGSTAS